MDKIFFITLPFSTGLISELAALLTADHEKEPMKATLYKLAGLYKHPPGDIPVLAQRYSVSTD